MENLSKEELLAKVRDLQEELKLRIEDNADQYATLCNALTQVQEANKVIRFYANTKAGEPQEDGTYLIKKEETEFGCIELRFDPRPAKDYLKKYGVDECIIK